MASVTHITDYLGRARSRLLLQFQNLPRIDGMLQAVEQEIQAVEDALYAVYYDRLIQNAVTVGDDDLIDKLGGIVGMPRLGETNANYLIMITAKIKANRSNAKREDLIAIMTLLAPSTTIVVAELPPATIVIDPQGPILFSPYIIMTWFLGPAKAAGVKIALIWTMVAITDTLTFGSIYNPGFAVSGGNTPTNTGVTTGQSPGSIYNPSFAAGPPPTNDGGGVFAGVVQA